MVTELKSRGYTEFEWLWNLVVTSRRNFVFVPSQFDYIGHASPRPPRNFLLLFSSYKLLTPIFAALPPQAAQEACFLIKKLPRIGKMFWRNYMWKWFWVWKCFECRIIKRNSLHTSPGSLFLSAEGCGYYRHFSFSVALISWRVNQPINQSTNQSVNQYQSKKRTFLSSEYWQTRTAVRFSIFIKCCHINTVR